MLEWEYIGGRLREVVAQRGFTVVYSIRPPVTQGPEEMCLSLEQQNPSKTSEIMGYFDRVDDRVTVSLHILYTANQETEGSQDRLTV